MNIKFQDTVHMYAALSGNTDASRGSCSDKDHNSSLIYFYGIFLFLLFRKKLVERKGINCLKMQCIAQKALLQIFLFSLKDPFTQMTPTKFTPFFRLFFMQ